MIVVPVPSLAMSNSVTLRSTISLLNAVDQGTVPTSATGRSSS